MLVLLALICIGIHRHRADHRKTHRMIHDHVHGVTNYLAEIASELRVMRSFVNTVLIDEEPMQKHKHDHQKTCQHDNEHKHQHN